MRTCSDLAKPDVEKLERENQLLRLHLATLVKSAENVTYRTLADFFQAIEQAKLFLKID